MCVCVITHKHVELDSLMGFTVLTCVITKGHGIKTNFI